jgi:hypothetical protein
LTIGQSVYYRFGFYFHWDVYPHLKCIINNGVAVDGTLIFLENELLSFYGDLKKNLVILKSDQKEICARMST